jgi:ABC-2 type transport system permease protein
MDIKTIMKKETFDGLRNYRFLILFAAIIFFAIFDPLMNKLVLPELLRSQFPNMPAEVMQEMLVTTQAANIRGYMNNVFQISSLVMAFALSGLIAQEISEKTLIFPVCTGKRYSEILLAKILVYGSFLLLAATVSALINYLYAGALFGFDLTAWPAIRAGMLQGFYMVYLVALLMFMGSLVRKAIPAGLLTLIPAYGTRVLGNLFDINRYLPSGLLVEAEMLAVIPSYSLVGSLVSTLALVILLLGFTHIRLTNLELTRG